MSSETDPATGMTLATPGSGAGDDGWRAALEEKARLMRSMSGRR
jgi:hypothetical protein